MSGGDYYRLKGAYRAVDLRKRPGWRIQIVAEPDTVEALKRAIPWTERSYREDNHIWWISQEYEPVLLRLFPEFAAYQAQQPLFIDGEHDEPRG